MTKICIIPARGGSKRIPKKNIKAFYGKPIIAFAVENALRSNLFDEVMVSTDDSEIQSLALAYGAKVPFLRSDETANDFATTFDVLAEVLNAYADLGRTFTDLCCMYPCTPLLNTSHLLESYELLKEETNQAVIPIVPFSFPIQRAFKKNATHLTYFYPEFEKSRSQDLEKTYHDAGQFYWIKVNALLQYKSLLVPQTAFFELDELSVQDIDNLSDWRMAELKYELKLKNE
jgi:pseudaminic acid cytidylyltransferase